MAASFLSLCGRSLCFHSAFIPSLAFLCWVSSIYLKAAPLADPPIALACIAVEGSQSPWGPLAPLAASLRTELPSAALARALPPPGPSSRESHTVTANYLTGSPILKILGWSGRRPKKTTEANPNSKHNPTCSLSTLNPFGLMQN